MISKPYGINEIVIKKGDTVVAFPIGQTLEFEERMVSGELSGDDGLQAIASRTNGVMWKLKKGGISLDAYALMTGRTVVSTGSTPNQVDTLTGGNNGLRMPTFDIYGKSLGDGDDDVWIHIIDAKITEGMKGSLAEKEFFIQEMGGLALDWEFVEHETAADLPEDGTPAAFTLTSEPADEDTDVALDSAITLTFSNALRSGSEDNIVLIDDAQNVIDMTMSISSSRKIVTLTPDANLDASTVFMVIVPNVYDEFDQALTNTVINFTTAAS